MSRLLIVSNRLPLTVKTEHGQVSVSPSSGGLATGLSGPHQRSGGLWLGWPGDTSRLSEQEREALGRQLAEHRCVPLFLTAAEVSRYYEGFSNGVLWPLFHHLSDRVPLHSRDWNVYRRVNQRFAELVAEHHRPGDVVWVHDYQLCLVPELLRRLVPEARIGFFLHIPFPSGEIFRTLPWREELLGGLLGADLVGFHTLAYQRHFGNALLHTLGLRVDADRVGYRGRQVRVGAYPMGVDAREFARLTETPEVQRNVAELRGDTAGQRIILGIDRLDYTKGIRRRLLAIERLLEREPALRGRFRFIQVAVPSRTMVDQYAQFRQQVDQLVGRINGLYATFSSVPIHYLFRSFSARQLAAMYRAADVLLVTPLRDGMNLVAKEFLACRTDEDGVLVLSEFAGAAAELGESLLVNPYDIDGVATCIKRALDMPLEERRARMRALRGRVFQADVHRWAATFLGDLAGCEGSSPAPGRLSSRAELDALQDRVRRADRVVLLLDYEGTVVPFVARPELARPDTALMRLLAELSQQPGLELHLISGRAHTMLESWFSGLPMVLHAEHGLWTHGGPGLAWRQRREVDTEWMAPLRALLETFVYRVPGSFIEQKTGSLAWHYRMADPEFGERQANELHLHLAQTLSNAPVEVVHGSKVVEVRPHGVLRAMAESVVERAGEGALIVALGDDTSDEELFGALPPDSILIRVGPAPSSQVVHRLPDVPAARALLRGILDRRKEVELVGGLDAGSAGLL